MPTGRPRPAFAGQQNPACQGYAGGGTQSQRRQLLHSVATPAGAPNAIVINPSALPSGAGLQISAQFQDQPAAQPSGARFQDHPAAQPSGAQFQDQQGSQGLVGVSVGLVQASPQCTGS